MLTTSEQRWFFGTRKAMHTTRSWAFFSTSAQIIYNFPIFFRCSVLCVLWFIHVLMSMRNCVMSQSDSLLSDAATSVLDHFLMCVVSLGVSISAIDCLKRLISEVTYNVSSGALNSVYSFARQQWYNESCLHFPLLPSRHLKVSHVVSRVSWTSDVCHKLTYSLVSFKRFDQIVFAQKMQEITVDGVLYV